MRWLLFVFAIIGILACSKSDPKYPYAIKDFSKKLQPHLHKIVANGLIGVDYNSEMFVENNSNESELRQMSFCEHPLLRAIALRALLKRDTLNQNEVILAHLTDSAFIVIDVSNWRASFTGINFISVADDMINHSVWKSFADREKIIDRIITKHNNLTAAYKISDRINPKEKYYASIKEMAQRDRDPKLILNTIIALGKFKKTEDIKIIKDVINAYNDNLKFPSFILEESNHQTFFNYLDTLTSRIIISSKRYQEQGIITWESYE